jgi:hypothetical protein
MLRREMTWAALPQELGWELKRMLEGDEAEVLEAPGEEAVRGAINLRRFLLFDLDMTQRNRGGQHG